MRTRKRIVEDRYAGYEVQVWSWWWPFWVQYNGTNTHCTVERAERYAMHGKVVKYLDD